MDSDLQLEIYNFDIWMTSLISGVNELSKDYVNETLTGKGSVKHSLRTGVLQVVLL